jgi:hypothetical protein
MWALSGDENQALSLGLCEKAVALVNLYAVALTVRVEHKDH